MPGKILIVDDVAVNRIILKVKLVPAFYETLQASDGKSALRIARSERPDLILLDMMLPDLNGSEVCARLREDQATRHIPVIMITALDDLGSKIRAFEAGADDYLMKPVDTAILLARVRSLIRARCTEDEMSRSDGIVRAAGFDESPEAFAPPARVAVVAPERATAVTWCRALGPHVPDRLEVMSRAEALAARPAPDAFIIATDGEPRSETLCLLSELRSGTPTRHSAICLVMPRQDHETTVMALDLGADDLMTAPFDPREMALRLQRLLRRKLVADRARASVRDDLRLALTDPLTGLYNRRYALPKLYSIAEQAREDAKPFAVMILDLDRFKAVNDKFGHAAGDAVLVEVARRMRKAAHGNDLLARIGGEEFLFVLPGTTLDKAQRTAERLRHMVEANPIRLPSGEAAITVTSSIGLALCPPDEASGKTFHTVIERADHALLDAKAYGRNKVTISRSAA